MRAEHARIAPPLCGRETPQYRRALRSAVVVDGASGLAWDSHGEGECGQVALHEPG